MLPHPLPSSRPAAIRGAAASSGLVCRQCNTSSQRHCSSRNGCSSRLTGSCSCGAGSGGGSGSGWRCVVAAARQQDGSSGPPASRSPRRRRQLRREDVAFYIAKSDLTWEQPWRFEQSASLPELQLRSQGVSALDEAAAAAPGRDHALAAFTVQLPTGMGALVVTGTVAAALPLRCEFCGEGYEAAVQEPFDAVVYMGGAPDGGAELAANELAFGLDDALCDITPLVTDAILAALPSVCLCGGGSCRQHAGREVKWSSTAPAAPAAAASPFAQLLSGKQKKGRARQ